MDQLSVHEGHEGPHEPSGEQPAAATSGANNSHLQAAENANSQPESLQKIPADDWGEFLGDDHASQPASR